MANLTMGDRCKATLMLSTLVLGLGPGCGNPTPPPRPPAFDRPEDVTFFCWNTDTESVTALADCTPDPTELIADDLGQPPSGYALHGLVTQTTTGEVAAVQITGAEGEPGVIDTDVRIPGFTFAAVGEVPSALAVSAINPAHVFVLSRGSNNIHVIQTADFRGGTGAAAIPYALPGERPLPAAMHLTPLEDALVVALPETGQLAQLPIADGVIDVAAARLLDLAADVPEPVDLLDAPADQRPPVWRYTCETPPITDAPVLAPRAPVNLGTLPRPTAILLDPETDQLLIADAALPVIHVVDPVTFTQVRTITTSVPVNALALTPRVPPTVGSTDPTERYLYAIDEIDGSVLVVDWSDPARATFGAVLPVEVAAPFDRLDVPFPARALAVVTPQYSLPIEGCTDGIDGGFASGINLHGVFLAVGTVDGRIRFFDVFDEDTNCRGLSCGGGRDLDVADQIVAIGRHRPRLGSFMETGVEVNPGPTWETDGVGVEIVGPAGQTNAPDLVPTLTAVDCDAPLDGVFPSDAANPLVCVIRDPWAAISQTFTSVFEGAVPFTTTSGANFEGDSLVSHTDYCALGVLGVEDTPDTEGQYLFGYEGDVVAITGDLPPSILTGDDEALLSRCEALTERTTAGEITPVLIQILRAESHPEDIHESYQGRLQLGAVLNGPPGTSLDDVRECYPELLSIEVRTRGVFTVTSGRRGFAHPIVEDELTHRCRVDPDAAAALSRGRARFNSTYHSGEITFGLGDEPRDIRGRHPQLTISVTGVPTPLTVDVSTVGRTSGPSLLTRLVYNAVDERLYAVDQSVQGLLRIKLTLLSVQQTFR